MVEMFMNLQQEVNMFGIHQKLNLGLLDQLLVTWTMLPLFKEALGIAQLSKRLISTSTQAKDGLKTVRHTSNANFPLLYHGVKLMLKSSTFVYRTADILLVLRATISQIKTF